MFEHKNTLKDSWDVSEKHSGSVRVDALVSKTCTLVIEIDFDNEPAEYGGAQHFKIMQEIEQVYPDAKLRKSSRMSLKWK